MKLSRLFKDCACRNDYQQVGDSVNYAFEEHKKNKTLYIYFQGSNSITDWVRNFLFTKRPYKDMVIPYRVHRGFLAAWKEVEDIIISKILERNENNTDYLWKHIIIVGYSHGGALTFFATECVWFYREDLREDGFRSYAFESPRVYAGFKIKKELKERWKNMIVIRCNNDLVTHCPPLIFGYTHAGEMIKIKGDTSLVQNKQPKCIKSHYPQVVYDGLVKREE